MQTNVQATMRALTAQLNEVLNEREKWYVEHTPDDHALYPPGWFDDKIHAVASSLASLAKAYIW